MAKNKNLSHVSHIPQPNIPQLINDYTILRDSLRIKGKNVVEYFFQNVWPSYLNFVEKISRSTSLSDCEKKEILNLLKKNYFSREGSYSVFPQSLTKRFFDSYLSSNNFQSMQKEVLDYLKIVQNNVLKIPTVIKNIRCGKSKGTRLNKDLANSLRSLVGMTSIYLGTLINAYRDPAIFRTIFEIINLVYAYYPKLGSDQIKLVRYLLYFTPLEPLEDLQIAIYKNLFFGEFQPTKINSLLNVFVNNREDLYDQIDFTSLSEAMQKGLGDTTINELNQAIEKLFATLYAELFFRESNIAMEVLLRALIKASNKITKSLKSYEKEFTKTTSKRYKFNELYDTLKRLVNCIDSPDKEIRCNHTEDRLREVLKVGELVDAFGEKNIKKRTTKYREVLSNIDKIYSIFKETRVRIGTPSSFSDEASYASYVKNLKKQLREEIENILGKELENSLNQHKEILAKLKEDSVEKLDEIFTKTLHRLIERHKDLFRDFYEFREDLDINRFGAEDLFINYIRSSKRPSPTKVKKIKMDINPERGIEMSLLFQILANDDPSRDHSQPFMGLRGYYWNIRREIEKTIDEASSSKEAYSRIYSILMEKIKRVFSESQVIEPILHVFTRDLILPRGRLLIDMKNHLDFIVSELRHIIIIIVLEDLYRMLEDYLIYYNEKIQSYSDEMKKRIAMEEAKIKIKKEIDRFFGFYSKKNWVGSTIASFRKNMWIFGGVVPIEKSIPNVYEELKPTFKGIRNHFKELIDKAEPDFSFLLKRIRYAFDEYIKDLSGTRGMSFSKVPTEKEDLILRIVPHLEELFKELSPFVGERRKSKVLFWVLVILFFFFILPLIDYLLMFHKEGYILVKEGNVVWKYMELILRQSGHVPTNQEIATFVNTFVDEATRRYSYLSHLQIDNKAVVDGVVKTISDGIRGDVLKAGEKIPIEVFQESFKKIFGKPISAEQIVEALKGYADPHLQFQMFQKIVGDFVSLFKNLANYIAGQ